MSRVELHTWPPDPDAALHLQATLRDQIILQWDGRPVSTIAGIDVNQSGSTGTTAVMVLSYPGMSPLETVTSRSLLVFPYIPGLFAFRVGPAILSAWEKLTIVPDVVMLHGHGTAHPRGCGLASQIGLWVNLPSIGVAKRLLYGSHGAVGPSVGEWSKVVDEADPNRVIGAALCMGENARPIYISPGHHIDLPQALKLVMVCMQGHRLPEPLRLAHQAANAMNKIS